MENPVKSVIESICTYFADVSELNQIKRVETLIRIHNGNLRKLGDISFPVDTNIWLIALQELGISLRCKSLPLLERLENDPDQWKEAEAKFLDIAAHWMYPVSRISLENGRYILFLKRNEVVMRMMQLVVGKNTNAVSYGQRRKDPHKRMYIRAVSEMSDCSLYRVNIIQNVLRRVLEYSEWVLLDNTTTDSAIELNVTSVENCIKNDQSENKTINIKCGIVIDPLSRKKTTLPIKDYIERRANEMRLLAVHKYGIRGREDNHLCAVIKRLGVAAVTVDMLEVKHSSPAHIICNRQGCTKGAAFILYNSARLETLLRTFNERVQQNIYSPLPDLDEVDLTLLVEEEEWQLVYNYIFAFPNLLERSIEQLESGQCALHMIVRFLEGLVSLFSVYYRRVRILTDVRDHLMPYVYARIYLIKAVREVLNKTLALLDIEPMEFM